MQNAEVHSNCLAGRGLDLAGVFHTNIAPLVVDITRQVHNGALILLCEEKCRIKVVQIRQISAKQNLR